MYVLQKLMITLFQILFVAAFYAKANVTSRAWKAACIGNRECAPLFNPIDGACNIGFRLVAIKSMLSKSFLR